MTKQELRHEDKTPPLAGKATAKGVSKRLQTQEPKWQPFVAMRMLRLRDLRPI
jgi:ribosomal protein S12